VIGGCCTGFAAGGIVAMAIGLFRYFAGRRKGVMIGCCVGFAAGVAAAFLLVVGLPGDMPFAAARTGAALAFIALCAGSVMAAYRSAGVRFTPLWLTFGKDAALPVAVTSLAAGALAGMLSAMRLPVKESPYLLILLFLGGLALFFLASLIELRLPSWLVVTGDALLLLLVAGALLISSYAPRLDLFAPLTMKLMKFTHDFVHQFFESMLLPDHPFVKSNVWGYIGLLFSNQVGFWVGLAIWFVPPALIIWALSRERLPSVSHIREGARRRKLLAAYMQERRLRLVIPLLATGMLCLALYNSRFPSVEYWDPKPIPVTATAAGEILLPLKSEAFDLSDGKLHKFIYRSGPRQARFFVLCKADGSFVVTLDACAICQPEGYGQADGTVICYYCKTLIPLETVGKPGGCNPVPVKFTAGDDGIRISGQALLNAWDMTVHSVRKVPGGDR
jgi:uncharacterized membrane protein